MIKLLLFSEWHRLFIQSVGDNTTYMLSTAIVLPNVLNATLLSIHIGCTYALLCLQQLSVAIVFKCHDPFLQIFLSDLQIYAGERANDESYNICDLSYFVILCFVAKKL